MVYKIALILLFAFNSVFSRKSKLSVLLYHRVLESKDDLLSEEVDKEEFERQVGALSKYFHVLSLSQAIEDMQKGVLPPNALCITFDDGYENNYSVALPVLKKHELSATFFVSSGYLDGGIMWNDVIIELIRNAEVGELDLSYANLGCHQIHKGMRERRELLDSLLKKIKHLDGGERNRIVAKIKENEAHLLPKNLMMTSEQVKLMSESGMEIGGHTITHPILTKITSDQVNEEVAQDKKKLETIVGKEITSFAYPNGKKGRDYIDEHAQIVKNIGYRCAVTTDSGVTTVNSDVFQLPRYTPWDKDVNKFIIKLMLNATKG